MKNKNPLKFALIELGSCVFGAGETRALALANAQIENGDGSGDLLTPAEIESELLDHHDFGTDGKFVVLESDHRDFDDYLQNQGGYEKFGGAWFEA